MSPTSSLAKVLFSVYGEKERERSQSTQNKPNPKKIPSSFLSCLAPPSQSLSLSPAQTRISPLPLLKKKKKKALVRKGFDFSESE